MDVESFAASTSLIEMRKEVNDKLQYFVDYCHQNNLASEAFASFGTGTVEELTALSLTVSKKYTNSIFFSSKLVFEHDNFITRLLHNETALAVQRSLHLEGKELVILPVKI